MYMLLVIACAFPCCARLPVGWVTVTHEYATSVDWSSDGMLLAVAGGEYSVWRAPEFVELARYNQLGPRFDATKIFFAADSTELVVLFENNSCAEVRSVSTGVVNDVLLCPTVHPTRFLTMAFSGDKRLIASVDKAEISIWAVPTCRRIGAWRWKLADLTPIATSDGVFQDWRGMTSFANDAGLTFLHVGPRGVWIADAVNEVRPRHIPVPAAVTMAVLRDSNNVVVASASGAVAAYSISPLREQWRFETSFDVTEIELNVAGGMGIVGGRGGDVLLFNVATGAEYIRHQLPTLEVVDVDFSNCGRHFCVAANNTAKTVLKMPPVVAVCDLNKWIGRDNR